MDCKVLQVPDADPTPFSEDIMGGGPKKISNWVCTPPPQTAFREEKKFEGKFWKPTIKKQIISKFALYFGHIY